jgi:hypothetical protein
VNDLRIKAQVALMARDAGDSRWELLLILLMQRTGLDQSKVTSSIEKLARGEVVA